MENARVQREIPAGRMTSLSPHAVSQPLKVPQRAGLRRKPSSVDRPFSIGHEKSPGIVMRGALGFEKSGRRLHSRKLCFGQSTSASKSRALLINTSAIRWCALLHSLNKLT